MVELDDTQRLSNRKSGKVARSDYKDQLKGTRARSRQSIRGCW